MPATPKLQISPEQCIGCGRCEAICRFDAIHLEDSIAVIDYGKCTACGKCVPECPVQCLRLEGAATPSAPQTPESPEDTVAAVTVVEEALQAYSGVWVFVEVARQQAHPVSWELLGAGRRLADALGVALSAVVLGHNVGELAPRAISFGADRVYVVDHPELSAYRTAPFARGCVDLVVKHKPEIMLIGATSLGRDLAGAVATQLGTGLTADCTGLEIEAGTRLLLQTRPAFGGNIMATIRTRSHRPQMATVRPRVMEAAAPDPTRQGEIIAETLTLTAADLRVHIVDFRSAEGFEKPDLSFAEVIVSGGRGLGGPAGFGMLGELAQALGGVVGASRGAVDAGWISHDHQVGQTGQTVRPRLYIACGISGAVQHRVGRQASDLIVAINSDPKAPIFQFATYGVVGDLYEIIPEMTHLARERHLKGLFRWLAVEQADSGRTP